MKFLLVFFSILYIVSSEFSHLQGLIEEDPLTLEILFKNPPVGESPEMQAILQQAKQAATKLESSIAQSSERIKQSVGQKTEEFQKQAEQESQKVFEHYAQKAALLKVDAEKQTLKLKHAAAAQILTLVNKAEKEALEARHKARQDMLQKTLTSFEKNGQLDSWKGRMRSEFSHAVSYLQEIITQGESAAEADDFLRRFNEQSLWFDNVLATTHQRTGPSYYQLDQKKTALNNIVLAQKDAEKILRARIQTTENSLPNYKKLRLLLLYEINDVMQQKGRSGIAAIASTSLTQLEKENIVDRILQVPSTTKEDGIKPDIEKKLHETQIQLDQTEMRITQLEQHINQPTITQFKQRVIPKMEALSKENIELQTIVLDTNQKLSSLKQQIAQATQQAIQKTAQQGKEVFHLKQQIGTLNKQHATAANQATVVSDLADRKIYENTLQFDVKKTLYNERNYAIRTKEQVLKNQDKLLQKQEKLLQNYQSWLDRLGQALVERIQGQPIQAAGKAQDPKQSIITVREAANRMAIEHEIEIRTDQLKK